MPEMSNRKRGRDTCQNSQTEREVGLLARTVKQKGRWGYLPEQSNRKGGRDTWQSWIERDTGMTNHTVADKRWREVGILLGQARHGWVRGCVCGGGGGLLKCKEVWIVARRIRDT